MKMIIAVLATVFAAQAAAQTTLGVTPDPVRGTYQRVIVDLDGPGTVTWNRAALNNIPPPMVTSGPCSIDTRNVGFPGNNVVPVGFTCTGPGSVSFITTGQLTSTCPGDGLVLQGLRLTLALDGIEVYSEELFPNPVTCWVTPAVPAKVIDFNASLVIFDNRFQVQRSALTTYVRTGPDWFFSNHTFLTSPGITCTAARKNVGTRWAPKYVETGFQCSGTVPAHDTSMISIQ
jgi:hypothetical protein